MKIFPLCIEHSCTTLQVKNSLKIALSRTVFEIFTLFHLLQYHLLQWEVAKVKQLMTSNMNLTVLNLHQKTLKGATTKIQVKRYKRDIREINSIRYPRRHKKASDMQDQRSNPGHTMTLHTYNP